MAACLLASSSKPKVYNLTLKHSELGFCEQRALDLFSLSALGTAWSQLTSDISASQLLNGPSGMDTSPCRGVNSQAHTQLPSWKSLKILGLNHLATLFEQFQTLLLGASSLVFIRPLAGSSGCGRNAGLGAYLFISAVFWVANLSDDVPGKDWLGEVSYYTDRHWWEWKWNIWEEYSFCIVVQILYSKTM